MITIPTCEVNLIDIKHLLALWTYQMCPHKTLWSQAVAYPRGMQQTYTQENHPKMQGLALLMQTHI